MFEGQFALVLTALATNVSLASELTYEIIVRPMVPAWYPQCVIPLTGMLLGNCINGIRLCLDSALLVLGLALRPMFALGT